jgi:hypothetical protein
VSSPPRRHFGELDLYPLPEALPFEVWYVPKYPIDRIDHTKHDAQHHAELRARLAENIKAQGMVNPLIVLNHYRPKCKPNWLMVGTNRLAAIKSLGWTHAPCIVTGPKPIYDSVPVIPSELPSYFKDGRPYLSAYGIAITGNIKPETFHYPKVT